MDGSNCVFPFSYDGKQHYECMVFSGTPWCHTDAIGTWATCQPDCPGTLEIGCIVIILSNLFQLKAVRPLVSFLSPILEHNMMRVSPMTMMAYHGVILVMVKRAPVWVTVQVTLC